MFRTIIGVAAFAAAGAVYAQPALPQATDGRLYELRTYYAAPGKLEALHARFRDHTVRLMERHGVTCHGFWVPGDDEPDRVVSLVSYPSAAARTTTWAGFATDREWLQVKRSSERQGRLVEHIADFPLVGSLGTDKAVEAAGRRVFEVKTLKHGEPIGSGEQVGVWVPATRHAEIARVVLVARPKVTARGQAPDASPALGFVSAIVALTETPAPRTQLLVPTDYSPLK
ncbi:MAG: NIPSNAP family protein [Gemmataceae bacterium]